MSASEIAAPDLRDVMSTHNLNASRLVVLVALLLVGWGRPAAASPVHLQCAIKGPGAHVYGPLTVEMDIDALTITIEAPRKWPGFRWAYRNGQMAQVLTQGPSDIMQNHDLPMTTPVAQFVQVTATVVTLGWRDSDGELGQVSSFNRSALDSHPARCVWHSAYEFGLA